MTELQTAEYYDEMNKVVEKLLTGTKHPATIAKELGMQRKDVVHYINEWKQIAQNRPDIQERAMEALSSMDRHYDMIIKEMWLIVETEVENKTRATVLKNIADVEAKRQETLQKAGMYDDSGIADQLAEMEEHAEAIRKLLTEVATKYPETKLFIMEGISRIFGQAPAVPDDDDGVIKGEISGS